MKFSLRLTRLTPGLRGQERGGCVGNAHARRRAPRSRAGKFRIKASNASGLPVRLATRFRTARFLLLSVGIA